MEIRRWTLILLAVTVMAALAGCGGGSGGQGNKPQEVSIAFSPIPPTSVTVGSALNLVAEVTNDSNNYGVDWSLTCQSGIGTCGSITPPHTASGAAATYTPPSSLGGNSLTGINLVALATADQAKNVVAPLTVTAFGDNLKGAYVLHAEGVDPTSSPYQFAGVIVLDGSGNITSGEQTVNTGLVSTTDAGLTGSYFLGNDGRGTITINDPNPVIGTETFAFVFLSNSKALISQMDFGAAATGASATGTMDLQTNTAPPSGGYAFAVSGTNIAKFVPMAFGGVFNVDSPNTISGNGSVADQILAKKVNASAVGLSGTVTNPDSFGAVTINLTAPFGPNGRAVQFQFTGYIVDDAHIQLIESDNTLSNLGFGTTGGLAIGQGAATGTFKDNTSLSGTYVFGIPGVDLSPNNSGFLPSTLTAVGLFSADGSGNLTNGFTDIFLQGNCVQLSCTRDGNLGAQISAAFGGTYSVDPTGTGRAILTLNNFNPNPQRGYQPLFFFYLTGNGNPPLVLQGGDPHYPSIGTGIAYPQSSASASLNGLYGFSSTQQNGGENDGTAQMTANAAGTPQVSGSVDANLGGGFSLDNGFLGAFSAPSSNAPFSGTVSADPNAANQNVFPLDPDPPMSVNYYFIDPGHGFFVETDLLNPTLPSGQVSFGYYAARTPVCAGCP